MSLKYLIDARKWPAEVDIIFGATGQSTWALWDEVSAEIACSVTVDFDSSQRCCGIEIWDVGLISPASPAVYESKPTAIPLRQGGALMFSADSVAEHQRLYDWAKRISCLAGDGDEHTSVHWFSRGAYDYSAELEELKFDAIDWLRVGLDSNGLLVGIRIEEPSVHIRGLQSGLQGLSARAVERCLRLFRKGRPA